MQMRSSALDATDATSFLRQYYKVLSAYHAPPSPDIHTNTPPITQLWELPYRNAFEGIFIILTLPFALAIAIPWAIGEAIYDNWRAILKFFGYVAFGIIVIPVAICLALGDAAYQGWDKLGRIRSSMRRRFWRSHHIPLASVENLEL
ncbi:hypothetical protein NM688_g7741 [Phlebia brevispora]|uniref:Uncharacterized protein n=1 Tax=Phlebia brevispora TaxID=194682 RepID=A0ACC1S1Q5_9APHY|nr:hypothetical protein NM688_g7741 [Phlebia brevispora]